MTTDTQRERTLFLRAIDIDSPAERAAFLTAACQGDASLLASVQALLRAHDGAVDPLDRPLAEAVGALDDLIETAWQPANPRPAPHAPGSRIGLYKLMELIGEGGFGLVYVADQQEPVRRRVALKIIKPGMESREVLSRFEAERQAIALMDHPHIARIFDAGTTDSGQPYFVMELVRGAPLTAFCDHHKLDTAQRLQLFVTICHAVQHAHQKGVIHRDLKPSNVLVALQDGQPLAKVIDFGVAKAVGQSLSARTIYTRFASMIGTPAYMSPEQAEISAVDVDTRSDIYSLGVLLYELLTGSTPFAADRLQSAGFDELRRIIREEDPPRPSTRLSTLDNQLADTIAANRRLDPAALASSLKRDLDWIVMKALDKDRNRRYATAGALAQDVSRYLADQPVEARPPTTWYRLAKFARRNKVALSTASLVALALVAGAVVSVWQARVAIRERDQKAAALAEAREAESEARAARRELEEFTDRLEACNVLIASARAHLDAQRWAEAYQACTEAIAVQPRYYLGWLERARLNTKLGRWREAAADFARALDIGLPVSRTELLGVPQLLVYAGHPEAYEQLRGDLAALEDEPSAVAIRGLLVGELDPSTAAELAERVERLLATSGQESGPLQKYAHMYYAANLYVAGWAHLEAGQLERAVQRLEESNQEENMWYGRGIGQPLLAIAYHERDGGVPAPRTGYAKVYVTVPGAHDCRCFGLYNLVEDVGGAFVAEHFQASPEALFKPVTPQPFADLGDDWKNYNQTYDPKGDLSEGAKDRLIEFCKFTSTASDEEFAARLGEYVDLDNLARYLAITVWLSDIDGILGPGQNYYVYLHPATEKLHFIPWDQDQTFGQFPRGSQEEREQLSIHHPWHGRNRFFERLFAVQPFKQAYLARLREFQETLFLPDRLARQVDELAEVIGAALAEESAERKAALENTLAGRTVSASMGPGFDATVSSLKTFVAARREAVTRQLDEIPE